jgi:hypothetical protein
LVKSSTAYVDNCVHMEKGWCPKCIEDLCEENRQLLLENKSINIFRILRAFLFVQNVNDIPKEEEHIVADLCWKGYLKEYGISEQDAYYVITKKGLRVLYDFELI